MKKQRKVTVILALLLLTALSVGIFPSCKESTEFYNVLDAGVVANDASAAKENLKKLNRLIRNAPQGTKVFFPKGEYFIFSDSNTGGIAIFGKKGLTLYGDGAVIINTSYSPLVFADYSEYMSSNILTVWGSEDIAIEGISFDYKSRVNACGVITAKKDGRTFFRAFDEYLTGENQLCGGEFAFSANFFDEAYAPVGEAWFEENSGCLLEKSTEESGVFSFAGEFGEVGQKLCVRFTSGTYACPEITVTNTKGFSIKDVTSFSCPSATVYAPCGNENFSFENFRIMPHEGSENLFASNVDCIHIKGLRGSLSLKDCTFEGIGDDALNVHSRAAVISSVEKDRVTATDGWTKKSLEDAWASVGDRIEFFDGKFQSLGFAVVKGFSKRGISFDAVPLGVEVGNVMQNVSFCPETHIENCTVKRGRARGFLLQTKNAEVIDCRFENMSLAGIRISPDISYWYEMGPAENVKITGCEFVNCCAMQSDANLGVITVCCGHDANGIIGAENVHKSIEISGNTFKDGRTRAVFARCVGGITITENRFDGASNAISTNGCTDVICENNG